MYFLRKKQFNALDSHSSQMLCESMHSIGNIQFMTDILTKISEAANNFVGSLKKRSDNAFIVYINPSQDRSISQLLQDYDTYAIDDPTLASYVPEGDNTDWIENIYVSAVVIVSSDIQTATSIYDAIQRNAAALDVKLPCEVASHSHNMNKMSIDMTILGIGLIHNKLVQLDTKHSVNEELYREVMRAYLAYNLDKCSAGQYENDDYNTLQTYMNADIYADSDIATGVKSLMQAIYYLSDNEINANVACNYERFKDKSYNSKAEFMQEINMSMIGQISDCVQDSLAFLEKCKNLDALQEPVDVSHASKDIDTHLDDFFSDDSMNSIYTLENLLDIILDLLFLKSSSAHRNIDSKIDNAIKKISRRFEWFKKRSYNVAYDAVYNK